MTLAGRQELQDDDMTKYTHTYPKKSLNVCVRRQHAVGIIYRSIRTTLIEAANASSSEVNIYMQQQTKAYIESSIMSILMPFTMHRKGRTFP